MQMTKFIPFGCIALTGWFFLANHNGVAEQQNKDRTGAPGSQPICSACHSGGNYDVSPFVMLTDLDNTTEFPAYVPGETYLLQFFLNESTQMAAGFGLQSTLLTSNGQSAGAFSNPSSNGQLENANNRHIFEHNDLSESNTFTVHWTAPAAGSGDVTLYYAGIAANGNSGTGGDATFSGSQTWFEGTSSAVHLESRPVQVAAMDGAITITGGTVRPEQRIDVFDMRGQKVAVTHRSDFRQTISTHGWPSGAYIVRLIRGQGLPPSNHRVFIH